MWDRVLVNGVEVVTGGAWNGTVAGRVLLRGEPDSVKTDPGCISYTL